MKKSKIMCVLLSMIMAASLAACGSSGSSDAPSEEQTTAAQKETKAVPDSSKTAAESVLPKDKDISPEDISVLWEDSRVYVGTSLAKYDTVATYAVKGFDDIPFMKVSDYLRFTFEDKASQTMDKGVMKISLNGTECLVDSEANTIHIENPAMFRSAAITDNGIDGAVVDSSEIDIVTVSVKNKSTQTRTEPLDISLDNYNMPVLALEDDILMPFMALQNTFGAITWNNEIAYNGKDYYNVYKVNNLYMDTEKKPVKNAYTENLYSGPFNKKKEASKAYAEYAYYATCLLLDLCYGHKEEKNITTFDEYFTRINTKKSLLSTNPSDVQMAETIVFCYLFDSGHDAFFSRRSVFAEVEDDQKEKTDEIIDDMKESEEGQELFEEDKKAESGEENDALTDTLFGALEERGYKIPELAPLMAWSTFMNFVKPKKYESERLDYADDTAVIYFDAFKNDPERDLSFYLDMPKEEDVAKSNFAFFYRCFEDIKKHDEVKNVVINLSSNGGGDATGLISILGFLSKDGEVKFTNLDMTTNSYREEYYHVDTNIDGVADDKDGYGGKYDFFIMTSGSSYSCGNALPYFAQQAGLAKVIGAKPGGGDCVVGTFTDAYGGNGAYSGELKLGKQEASGFVSNEKATTLDYDMMPSILDINSVPWFDANGIMKAVHKCKEGKTKESYPVTEALESLPDRLEAILKEFESEK